MTIVKERNPSRSQKWGWGILLAVSALLAVNGAVMYFVIAATQQGRNMSILLAGLGLQALIVALGGYRHRSRWAWNAAWVLVAVLAAIGAQVLVAGEDPVGAWYLFLAAAALVGQLLAGRELAP